MYPEIHTKWGIAKIQNGYYKVGKKSLHRLIYEDNNKCTLLSTTHIHHINGNKLDNSIGNLVALSPSEHRQAHKLLRKRQKDNEKTIKHEIIEDGFPRIIIRKTGEYSYLYKYYIGHNFAQVYYGQIIDKNIDLLMQKVVQEGLSWYNKSKW